MNRYRIALVVCMVTFAPHPVRAGEPTWNPKAAAKYLNERAQWWLGWSNAARGQGTACISCHTTLPYMLARPALGAALGEKETSGIEKQVLDNVRKRVENWPKIVTPTADKDPFRPFYGGERKLAALGTESVVNALVLVNNDFHRNKGALSASAKKAFGHLWEQQQKDGAWLWLDFGLRPWETEAPYYGASLAALAVGMAGESISSEAEPKVAALKKYLAANHAKQPLHHRMAAVWASSKLSGIVTDEDKKKVLAELRGMQEADGGWTSAKLGKKWKSHGVTAAGAVSDGYATGLAVLTLKGAGVSDKDESLKKGVGWLVAQQKEGIWPATYLNKPRDPQTDVGKFMGDASAAFAALALLESQ